jgi:hypothetical protein
MRKLVKPISIVLTIAYLLLIPLTSFAVTGTTSSTGDTTLLTKWKGLGLLDKSVTAGDLYKPIQKIDFIGFINGILMTSKKASISFSDVPEGSWYGNEIAKAVASGFVENKEKTSFYPFSNITRLDAAIMVSKVFSLELADKTILNGITDAEKLDADQLEAFGAVVEKGYLSEISSGRYVPLGVIKLIDAMKMLDKCIGLVITKSGTITSSANGNMIVNANSVLLKNMEVSGDLIIGDGVSDGTVTLENVSVRGKLVIRGGGTNGVIIKNSRVTGDVIVEKYAGNVHVIAQGTTTIAQTYLKSGGTLSEANLTSGKGFVNVTAAEAVNVNQVATLEGEFSKIDLDNTNINVKLTGKSDNVNVLNNTVSRFSLVSGSANNITTKTPKSTIEILGGTVKTLNVEKGANGTKIDINGVTTVSNMEISDTASINFSKGTVESLNLNATSQGSNLIMQQGTYLKTFTAKAAANINGLGTINYAYIFANDVNMNIRPGGAYIATGIQANINGTIIDSTKPTVSFSVPSTSITLQQGAAEVLAMANLDPGGTTLSFISSDNSIATVSDSGVVTGVSIGTTKIHVMGQYTNYNTKVVDIEVTVTSNNVTAAGTLEISPSSGEAGTAQDFQITYTAGDGMSNGTVVISLPNGFSAYVTDTVSINGGTVTNLTSSQVPNIHTLSFTNLNLLKGQTIIVKLKNRVVPTGGTYTFSATSDADATGPKLAISGKETATFTSDSLRILIEGTNYSTPEYGTVGGTTKISRLLFTGFTGATKWLIKVQDDAFVAPGYEDTITGIEYTPGDNISVAQGQHLMVAAVAETGGTYKVKAYKDITITGSMIRPYSADKLDTTKYTLSTGIRAGATRITGLDLTGITGAAKWMYKVQNTAISDVYVNTEFKDGIEYTAGDDILVTANQHIVLAAVDSSGKVKAFSDNKITSDKISTAAGTLVQDNNFSIPTYGEKVGTIKIQSLNKGDTADFANINKWMVVTLGNVPVTPAFDVSTAEFERYTEGKTFTDYSAGSDITVSSGEHLLLVGIEVDGSLNRIQAFVDLTVDGSIIRQADAPEIPDINFAAPVMGSKAGTTMFSDLNFNTSTTGASIQTDATKYMVKVQNEALTAPPQLNSVLSGASNCTKNQDITISAGQHLILLATDANGKIKAYKDIVVGLAQIRPADALKLLTPNDYTLPSIGSAVGTTRIVLSANGISGFVKWRYKIQSTTFDTPYKGSVLTGMTDYTSGSDIAVSVGQYILVIAVNSSDETLAYTVEAISASQIKQPQAGILKASSEVTSSESYNYSDPEAGQVGGTTRITTLSTLGVQGATKWLYKISDTAVSTPDYNSVISGLLTYTAGDSIAVTAGQHFILYAADSSNRIKAYKDITITSAQIRIPAATVLVSQTNYSVPTPGSTQGTTVISSLSFAGLTGSDASWSWKYAVGNALFSAPAKDSNSADITGLQNLTTTTEIPVTTGQYILLLAVDSTGKVKGYANIYVYSSSIRAFDADLIPSTSYSLIQGTSAGTTSFNKLDLIGVVGATNWMIKTQAGAFSIPAKDAALSGSTLYTLNTNITIKEGWHILLLATDSLNRVKAYADITVTSGMIKPPYADLLIENTNYTAPEQGSAAGTTKIMLSDTGIEKQTGETVVWKYKKSAQSISSPLLNEDASAYTAYTSNGDISINAGEYILIAATINNQVVAFKLFNISASQIKPADAPELVQSYNYSAPTAGTTPGTTKITDLKLIGIVGATKWQVKVIDAAAVTVLSLDSVFTTPINYASGDNISVKANQYVVLAAVDAAGKVKAYKNIQILASMLNPPLADKLVSGLNYTTPKYGTLTGTTSVYVSAQGISGCTGFVAKVVNSAENIIAGQVITPSAGSGSSYTDYRSYTSGSDIAASNGQYLLLIAVDTDNKALAYDNIQLAESNIRPGNAIQLAAPQNYSVLQPGSGVGTTKFTDLTFVGIPGASKWIVKVQDVDLTDVPLINSSVTGAVAYQVNQDISAKEGQYVILYAVDATSNIKGYINLKVYSQNIRGVAPQLALTTNYSAPEPGSTLNTTKISTLNLPSDATMWKYAVQDSAAATILKDSLLTGLNTYTSGTDISALGGQHLILVATDNSGYVKAYADITLAAGNIRNVEATLSSTITDESSIVSGGRTITVKLAYGVWQDDVLSNTTKRNALYDGFTASGTEQLQWGKVITILKNEGASAAVMNAAKDTITITLSETAAYDITNSQQISLTISPELIKNAVKSATSVNTIKIAANVVAVLEGTVITAGVAEGDIVAGGKTIIVRLTNGEFAVDVASNAAKRNAIFDGFKTSSSDPAMWNKVISALKLAGESAITRNSSNKITITLPAVSDYDISLNETISLTLPYMTAASGTVEPILVDAIKDVAVSTKITIASNTTASLSGTLISSTSSETDIVNGGKTLTITLADGQWVTDIESNSTKRNALFAGLAASTETTVWSKVVSALQTAGQSAIKRNDNSTVTITLPATAAYNITANQYITMTVPASCIIGGTANIIAAQTITVGMVATATLSGTVIGTTVDEAGIRAGGKTLIITLNNATWASDIATNTDIKNALFDGFSADVETDQWVKVVTKLKSGANITKTASNIITITFPIVSDYDITVLKQIISVTIPTSAVVGTSFAVQSTNTISINYAPPTAAKVVEVRGQTGTYKLDDVITINVVFDTAVDVTGIPKLALETGDIDRIAEYISGSGTNVLSFKYTVQSGDSSGDLDYKDINSLTLSGASIVNTGTNVNAIVTLAKPGSTSTGSLSNTSNILVDAVAPKIATGYPKAGTKTETTANILVKVDKASKIYYVTVLDDINNLAPTADQVIAGQDVAGTAVATGMKGTLDMVGNVEGTLAVSGLTAYTSYTIYVIPVDSAGNKGTVTAYDFASADTTAPQFSTGYPAQKEPKSDNLINVVIKTNEDGNVYLVALPVGSAAPTSAQVKSFKNASGTAVAANMRATAAVTKDTEITLPVTGLTVSTQYDIYVVCADSSGNIIDTPAILTGSTSQLNMDNVSVNLAKSILTNTTTQMEYSFNEQTWYKCTATNTSIVYDSSAEMLAIFVREANNITNVRALDIITRENESIIIASKIDYNILAKTITNTNTNADSSVMGLQYRVNGGAWKALNASAANVEFEPGLLEVRTAATELKLPSLPVTIDNIPVQMPAPDLLYNDDENTIYGLESTYEYRINAGTWQTGAEEGSFTGTKKVEVRTKATKERLASVAQVIQFTAGTIQVVAAPAASDKTRNKNYVTVNFEEATNKIALTPQNIRDYFIVGTLSTTSGAIAVKHSWGSDFTSEWNTAGDTLTIIYNTMTDCTVKIGDEVIISAAAGIKNSAGTSQSYTSKGALKGSFHSVPSIVSVKAENANNTIGFNNGDRIVITFDQATNKKALTAADIDQYLKVTDSTGAAKTWGVVADSDIVWDADGTKLTITFKDITKTTLKLSDKITVSALLGLTDADETTEACNFSSYISGSFTSTPQIVSAVIKNNGAAGKNIGDTITITFDQVTNKKAISVYQLVYYFKLTDSAGTTHSWGSRSVSDIAWSSDGKSLIITLSSITGVTLANGDTLTINSLSGIKDAENSTQACSDSIVITGNY